MSPTVLRLACPLVTLGAAEEGVGDGPGAGAGAGAGAGVGDDPSGVTPAGKTPSGKAPLGEVTPGEACYGRRNSTVPAGVSTSKPRAVV